MSSAAWLLVTFLLSPQGEGALSMNSSVIGVSRVYESEKSCRRGAAQLQRRTAAKNEEGGKVAMICLQGLVYGSEDD